MDKLSTAVVGKTAILDLAKAALRNKADLNGDGKIDKKDVEQAISRIKAVIDEEAVKYPTGTVILTAVGSFALGVLACWVF